METNLHFTERLKTVMEFHNLTATALADSIGIQRSSISHLLSGRNKPSLDFVLKILQKYPEVELYWLMNGKGVFPKKETINQIPPPPISHNKSIENNIPDEIYKMGKLSDIEKIVVFYKNGTFKSYLP
ncbi:MAG: helix-turn-helix transcriptional regulator [Flavobacteriaceae bacterium]|nr:helix-turn-helix transcriptional regulator [Flavobacteriaceae bacterium]